MGKYADIIGNEMTGPELSCVLKAEREIKKYIRKVGEKYLQELAVKIIPAKLNKKDQWQIRVIMCNIGGAKEIVRRLTK